MPSPIMLSEAAPMFGPSFTARTGVRCRNGEQFEILARMHGVDVAQMDPVVFREAKDSCADCACRKACRNWLRTGIFEYSGDPRCPNTALLRQ